jgi:hypothetical protein
MLSRKNLTLSASVLSNGLNLGTRSRAANADVNLDGKTLRILLSHHGVMREGMDWYSFSKPKSKPGIPSIPISISPVQVQQPSCGQPQPGGWAVVVCDLTEARPANLAGRREPRREDRVTRFPTLDPNVGSISERGLECQALARPRVPGNSAGFHRTARRAAIACSAAARATTVGK